ncbi:MAG: bifunctional phosphopantothenoylcysteine decarboxylase/phosphopantothenate synthase [Eggerthellaceae bacterium]
MDNKKQTTVLIGVSGCIAAYKACEVLRGLQKRDIRVKVVMTEHATHFIDPLTFRALTHEPVAIGLFDDPQDPIHHISLAQEADLFLLAPCTANVMAKAAHGIADDLLTTTILATTAPIMVCPAMNVHMYENAATQENIEVLRRRGFEFIEADSGYLACGDIGKGRLAEPEHIVDAVMTKLASMGLAPDAGISISPAASDTTSNMTPCAGTPTHDLAGKKVMITAGPTLEPIDPVRQITNRSSGKFGYAIAKAAQKRGADVTLISGPVSLPAPEGVKMIYIETARDLLAASEKVFPSTDIALFSAAVADMRPASPSDHKLKKGIDDALLTTIELVENPDVLATMGKQKTTQTVVGFAAETHDVVHYAQHKLIKKNADMIVANEVGTDKTFGKDDDEIWLVTHEGTDHIERAPKSELANLVLSRAAQLFAAKSEKK